MTTIVVHDVSAIVRPTTAPSVDTVRALCHDLRQPLAAIQLLAGLEGGEVRTRLEGILAQARWLSDMVEGVIGEAAHDVPENIDVLDLVSRCVIREQLTATCRTELFGTDRAMAMAAPVALSRAVSCVLDNAVRAAGSAGEVVVEVTGTAGGVAARIVLPAAGSLRAMAS